jgi:hypothetical protein
MQLVGIGDHFAYVDGWGQDGVSDLVINARFGLVDGNYSSSFDLADVEKYATAVLITVVGGFRGAYASVGDINGDTIEDLIIGEPGYYIEGYDEDYLGEGRCHLVWGPAELEDIDVPSLFEQGLGSRVTGVDYGQEVGRRVASAGDANGDGLSDTVMTTVGNSRSALVFGDASPMSLSTLDIEAGMGGYPIEAPASSLLLPLGDVDGDGLADHTQIGSSQMGSTISIIYGKNDVEPVTLDGLKVGEGGFIIDVSTLYSSGADFGVSGASLGDFDGDGWHDLVVTAGVAPAARRIFMIRGAESWGQPTLATLQAEDRIRLFEGPDYPGGVLSFVDDLNGDGRDELLAGWPFSNTVYLVFGQEGTHTISLESLVEDKTGVKFRNTVGHIGLGRGLIGTRDLTGDGIAELVLGAPQASPMGRPGAGQVFIVDGAALVAWL